MAKNIELKDEITLDEYKAWLTGMLRGKGNQLPDLKDWKAIKKMTDKIVPDVIETTPWTLPVPYIVPDVIETTPWTLPVPYVVPVTTPEPAPLWWENQPICSSGDIASVDNITITNDFSSISMDTSAATKIATADSITIGYNSGTPTNHYIETATKEHLAQIAKITGMEK